MNYDASYHIPISLAHVLYMNLDLYCTQGADPENYVGGGQKFLFKFFFLFSHHMGLSVARKPVFEDLRTTQAQTSLRICSVWSAPFLFAIWKVSYVNLLQVKLQFSSQSVYSWGDWFETRLFRNPEDRFSRDEAHILLSGEDVLPIFSAGHDLLASETPLNVAGGLMMAYFQGVVGGGGGGGVRPLSHLSLSMHHTLWLWQRCTR